MKAHLSFLNSLLTTNRPHSITAKIISDGFKSCCTNSMESLNDNLFSNRLYEIAEKVGLKLKLKESCKQSQDFFEATHIYEEPKNIKFIFNSLITQWDERRWISQNSNKYKKSPPTMAPYGKVDTIYSTANAHVLAPYRCKYFFLCL